MTTYRDDIDAAYARIEALERENRQLAKRAGVPPAPTAAATIAPRGWQDPTPAERIEYLEHENQQLAASNVKLRAYEAKVRVLEEANAKLRKSKHVDGHAAKLRELEETNASLRAALEAANRELHAAQARLRAVHEALCRPEPGLCP